MIEYSRTPLIRKLFMGIANYPDRIGPSAKFVENSTKLTCLEIIGYRINLCSRNTNWYGKNYATIGSNWNENTEKNYKQNKDGQNEKRKNTGNMWDPKK